MAKQYPDLEKLFQEKFNDFAPQTSSNFSKKVMLKVSFLKIWAAMKLHGTIILLSATIGLLVMYNMQEEKIVIPDNSIKVTKQISTKQKTISENTELTVREVKPADSQGDIKALNKEKLENGIDFVAPLKKRNSIIIKQNDQRKQLEHRMESISYMSSISTIEYFEISQPPKDISKDNLKLTILISINPEEKTTKKKRRKTNKSTKFSLFNGQYLSSIDYYGEFYAMPFLFSNLITKIELPQNDTITFQQTTSKPQLSYEFGFGFRMQKKNTHWFLKTALNYQIFTEKIDYLFRREYIDYEKSYWEYDSIWEYHIDPPNFDTVLAGVDSAYIEYWIRQENSKKHINTYQFIEIPFLLGYDSYKTTKKVSFQISMGFSMALLIKSQGYLYDNYGSINNYSNVKATPSLQWYYLLNLGLNYHFKSNTFFVQPSFKYQLNHFVVKSYPVHNKYLIYGIKFGLRINLFPSSKQL